MQLIIKAPPHSLLRCAISERIMKQVRIYSQITFGISDGLDNKIKYTKNNYMNSAKLHHKIEASLMDEYIDLPDVKAFLKRKSRKKSSYRNFYNTQKGEISSSMPLNAGISKPTDYTYTIETSDTALGYLKSTVSGTISPQEETCYNND